MHNKSASFGTEELRRLRKVLLHKPKNSLRLVNEENYQDYLFNFAPDITQYREEHNRYSALLQSQGIEVLELEDCVHNNKTLVNNLPNLAYLNDICLITSQGAILSQMCPGSRAGEEVVMQEVLDNLGIPIYHQFEKGDQFEGCLAISSDTLFVADTERHSRATIENFIPKALRLFSKIIFAEIPQARRYMHPDMIFGRISENLALVYPPAFQKTYLITADKRTEIDLHHYFKTNNMDLIAISDQEQQNWGCSFITLEANKLIHYDIALNLHTQNELSKRGVEILEYHPEALLAGGGSLRCLTLRVLRGDDLQ